MSNNDEAYLSLIVGGCIMGPKYKVTSKNSYVQEVVC